MTSYAKYIPLNGPRYLHFHNTMLDLVYIWNGASFDAAAPTRQNTCGFSIPTFPYDPNIPLHLLVAVLREPENNFVPVAYYIWDNIFHRYEHISFTERGALNEFYRRHKQQYHRKIAEYNGASELLADLLPSSSSDLSQENTSMNQYPFGQSQSPFPNALVPVNSPNALKGGNISAEDYSAEIADAAARLGIKAVNLMWQSEINDVVWIGPGEPSPKFPYRLLVNSESGLDYRSFQSHTHAELVGIALVRFNECPVYVLKIEQKIELAVAPVISSVFGADVK